MDRRQRKTREAIFEAFTDLLSKKEFSRITVGEIIESAGYLKYELVDAITEGSLLLTNLEDAYKTARELLDSLVAREKKNGLNFL